MVNGIDRRAPGFRMSRRVRIQQLDRIPRIAEVFEDLATEVQVETIVYEDFLDLNPQVRRFPNVNPDTPLPERADGGLGRYE